MTPRPQDLFSLTAASFNKRWTAFTCLMLMTFTMALGMMLPVQAQRVEEQVQAVAQGQNKPAAEQPTQPEEIAIGPKVIYPTDGSQSLKLGMKQLGDEEGYTLKTVKTERRYPFTRPTGWKVMPSSHIKVVFQHSPALLPERSSLNILVNNRILKTIPLTKANITANTVLVPIPPEILKDYNSVSFQVDQHYTYDCEDPFSAELWTEILKESYIRLDYVPQPIKPNLAKFPYPLFDPLGYDETRIGYVAPNGLSDESLTALGTVAAGFAQRVSWHPLKTYIASTSEVSQNGNFIVIGTPTENQAIQNLGASLPLPLSGGKFSNKGGGTPLSENTGVLLYLPNPSHTSKGILVVSGNSPKGVMAAARLLVQNPPNQLINGQYAIVEEQNPGPTYAYRAWDGFIQASGATFSDLGLDTHTTRGVTSVPIYYALKRMPDLYFPGQTKVGIKTIFSYSSQLEGSQSKLEVRLNGKPYKSVPLNNPKGENLAEFVVDIPAEAFNTFNDLEYKFHLYPEKYDVCRFVTDVHIWGTIHNSSAIEVPGEVKAPLPDIGYLNDAGFPFTGYQDLSQVATILPETPKTSDMALMVQFLSRLGRESKSKGGINLFAVHAGSPMLDTLKKDHHMVIIGDETSNSLFKDIKSKLGLIISGDQASVGDANEKLSTLHHTPEQGILEELISPWNDKRVIMLAYGKTETAMSRLNALFEQDKLFGQIPSNINILAMNSDGPKGLQVLKKGEASFFFSNELRKDPTIPTWLWVVLGVFAFIGVISTLRFLFSR